VAPIKDSAIRLLSLKLTPALKSILRQDNRDFTKNNKSINYNDYNSINKADP
jgi:hypothetical protein